MRTMLALSIGCLALMNTAISGTMGDVEAIDHSLIPFATAEGFPVWINFGGITINKNGDVSSVDTGNYLSGGGRGAVGFTYPYKSNLDFSLETGWNYFGHTGGEVNGTGFSGTITGADLLAGVIYKTMFRDHTLEWFLKGGTLFQRTAFNYTLPSTYLLNSEGYDYYTSIAFKGSISDILPEVKVGLMYDINPNWALTAAYMTAFGGTPKFASTTTKITEGSLVNSGIVGVLRGPTLNSAMFGVRYQLLG